MLKIRDLNDLKKYLETRKEMAEKQSVNSLVGVTKNNASHGMVYAFDEALRAVIALMEYEIERDHPDNWLEPDEE